MATRSITATSVIVSEKFEMTNPLMDAYRYRVAIFVWTEEKPLVVNILTNSITYANMTARQFQCRKFEEGKEVIGFSANVEGDTGEEGENETPSDERRGEIPAGETEAPRPRQSTSAKPGRAKSK